MFYYVTLAEGQGDDRDIIAIVCCESMERVNEAMGHFVWIIDNAMASPERYAISITISREKRGIRFTKVEAFGD